MTAPASAADSARTEPEVCLHFHALFLDTQLDLILSPGLGRRIRAGLVRLVTGGRNGARADGACGVPEETDVPEGKETAR